MPIQKLLILLKANIQTHQQRQKTNQKRKQNEKQKKNRVNQKLPLFELRQMKTQNRLVYCVKAILIRKKLQHKLHRNSVFLQNKGEEQN